MASSRMARIIGGVRMVRQTPDAEGSVILQSEFRNSVSAFTGKHSGQGAEQQLEIEPKTLIFDVFDVELDLLFEGEIAAAFDLPEACQARSHFEPSQVVRVVLIDFTGERRPRAHE